MLRTPCILLFSYVKIFGHICQYALCLSFFIYLIGKGVEPLGGSPEAGIGPATYWLTASRSTTELFGLEKRKRFCKAYYSKRNRGAAL